MVGLSRTLRKLFAAGVSALALTLVAGMATSPGASAGEEEAKALLKAMTDYLAAQKAIWASLSKSPFASPSIPSTML